MNKTLEIVVVGVRFKTTHDDIARFCGGSYACVIDELMQSASLDGKMPTGYSSDQISDMLMEEFLDLAMAEHVIITSYLLNAKDKPWVKMREGVKELLNEWALSEEYYKDLEAMRYSL